MKSLVASVTDEEQYKDAVQKLRDSSVYQKPNVKSYVENTWMACEKRWARQVGSTLFRRGFVVCFLSFYETEFVFFVYKFDLRAVAG